MKDGGIRGLGTLRSRLCIGVLLLFLVGEGTPDVFGLFPKWFLLFATLVHFGWYVQGFSSSGKLGGYQTIPSSASYSARVAWGGSSNFFSSGDDIVDRSLFKCTGRSGLFSLGPPGKKTVFLCPAVSCDKVSSSVSSASAKIIRGRRF